MARVFVDTNVLFPFSIMDVMLALTVAGRANVIVTWNQADFPVEPLAAMGLRVADPDQYLCKLFSEEPQEVAATVIRLAGEKRRPSKTPSDLASDLAKAGVPIFAERLRTMLDQTS